MSLWGQSVINFKSCKGGNIISQSYAGQYLLLSVSQDAVIMSLGPQNTPKVEVRVPAKLLDNKWHSLELLYQLGNLILRIDEQNVIMGEFFHNLSRALVTARIWYVSGTQNI